MPAHATAPSYLPASLTDRCMLIISAHLHAKHQHNIIIKAKERKSFRFAIMMKPLREPEIYLSFERKHENVLLLQLASERIFRIFLQLRQVTVNIDSPRQTLSLFLLSFSLACKYSQKKQNSELGAPLAIICIFYFRSSQIIIMIRFFFSSFLSRYYNFFFLFVFLHFSFFRFLLAAVGCRRLIIFAKSSSSSGCHGTKQLSCHFFFSWRRNTRRKLKVCLHSLGGGRWTRINYSQM